MYNLTVYWKNLAWHLLLPSLPGIYCLSNLVSAVNDPKLKTPHNCLAQHETMRL
jgi:hypothetical protein